jgi:hypothetical protein
LKPLSLSSNNKKTDDWLLQKNTAKSPHDGGGDRGSTGLYTKLFEKTLQKDNEYHFNFVENNRKSPHAKFNCGWDFIVDSI